MAIGASIDRALKLFEEATQIYHRVSSAVTDGIADVDSTTLKDAQDRLQTAMEKATEAHDSLDAAITKRLSAGG